MSEKPLEISPAVGQAMEHLHALMLLDEIEESVFNLSADFRELRVRITQLGLLGKECTDVAE